MRELATIQKVKEIKEIKDSDFIELVTFENIGWQCVAKKNEFKKGDLGVYFEVDSFLPVDNKNFEFLAKSSFRKMFTGEEGYRLRTMKMRGSISQGLFLPLNLFPELKDRELLDNVSEELNVIKWEREPSISMCGDIIGDYPAHTPKSHQPRIQNCLEFFELYKDVKFERTMKLEGTSTSYHWVNSEMGASSHNTTYARNNKFSPWEYAENLKLEQALKAIGRNITIQGEFMGPKIQGNIENFAENHFYVYDIWDIDKSQWLIPSERHSILNVINDLLPNDKELRHVPVLDAEIKIFSEINSLEEILEMAEGRSINAKLREGDVYKSVEKVNGEYIHFKVISNKYLLKEKD